eukprot:GHVR01078187.1.p1 GENE.GHVR01078187.1~~GHVR01078187.1.p1  ORF type:complete len:771 (+),score=129.06 GHVR01078187.1:197-2509(+)
MTTYNRSLLYYYFIILVFTISSIIFFSSIFFKSFYTSSKEIIIITATDSNYDLCSIAYVISVSTPVEGHPSVGLQHLSDTWLPLLCRNPNNFVVLAPSAYNSSDVLNYPTRETIQHLPIMPTSECIASANDTGSIDVGSNLNITETEKGSNSTSTLSCSFVGALNAIQSKCIGKKWVVFAHDHLLMSPVNVEKYLTRFDYTLPLLVSAPYYKTDEEFIKKIPDEDKHIFYLNNTRGNTLPWNEKFNFIKSGDDKSGYVLSMKAVSMINNIISALPTTCSVNPQHTNNCTSINENFFEKLVTFLKNDIIYTDGFHSSYSTLRGSGSSVMSINFSANLSMLPYASLLLNGPVRHKEYFHTQQGEGCMSTIPPPMMRSNEWMFDDYDIHSYNQDLDILQSSKHNDTSTVNMMSIAHTRGAHTCKDMITDLQQKIKNTFQPYLKDVEQCVYVGVPDHPNRGDSAILEGARELLRRFDVQIVNYTHLLDNKWEGVLESFNETIPISRRALVWHGGGNFGDLYYYHERTRLITLNQFHEYNIVSFPQTMNFKSEELLNRTIEKYRNHQQRIVMSARDTITYNKMKKHFNMLHVDIHKSPDLAFMLGDQRHMRLDPVVDILVHARQDNEDELVDVLDKKKKMKDLTQEDLKTLVTAAAQSLIDQGDPRPIQWFENLSILIDDWVPSEPDRLHGNMMERCTMRCDDGMKFLSRGRVVITNRLHGHILMILMGIPHVVLMDKFGKLETFSKAYTHVCPLGKFAPHNDLLTAFKIALYTL